MFNYLTLMNFVRVNGCYKHDRTGTGTKSVFGQSLRFDLSKGLPIITTKKVHLKSIIHELLWFLNGDTNTKYLKENGVSIWDEWANNNGDLGPVYGKQWRYWGGKDGKSIDQIEKIVSLLKNNKNSRRIVLSAWNVDDLPDDNKTFDENIANDKMALAPCHFTSVFNVTDGKLNCLTLMRSVDVFLGMPYNITSYSLLVFMLAQQCDLDVGELVMTFADTHLYMNHLEQAEIQLSRTPSEIVPQLTFKRKPDNMFDYKYEDFIITDYHPQSIISAPIAV